jgi:FkbM family methyltransferase
MALWQGWKRTVRRPYNLVVYGDLIFRAYPDSSQPGRFIYFGGLPDFAEMTFMRRYLRPGDGFIDGGANEGMYALLAGKLVGPAGEVHAFEAAPSYVDRLRANLAANGLGWVTVHPAALGAVTGRTSFAVRGSGSRIETAEDRDNGIETIAAEMTRLEDALPDRPWAMGKLDIEGAEQLALMGAESLVNRAEPPVWMLECVDRFLRRFGSSVLELRRWLGDRGFDFAGYDPCANRLVPVPDPAPGLVNVFAVARSRRGDVDARLSARA